jgi:alpha-ketoglutarate-dependent taurine dioxygenase
MTSLSETRPRAVPLGDPAEVSWSRIGDLALPAVVRPSWPGIDLATWLAAHRGVVEGGLTKCGALLFRGFAVTADDLPRAVSALSPELVRYRERSTPRTQVGEGVYTSTEYPADQAIPLHHENAYSHACPRKLWLYCERPADHGGETPLADGADVYRAIPAPVRDAFESRGVLYARHYRAGEDLPWQVAFQTDDHAEVERYCAGAGIACHWAPDGTLRTRQVRSAAIRHPLTHVPVWFNQAHLFHVSTHAPDTRAALEALYAPAELPRHAWYGDGSAIDDASLAAVRAAYDSRAVTFSWQEGDLLLVDNLRVAHGRRPYRGLRRVLVAMSDAWIDPARSLPATSPTE